MAWQKLDGSGGNYEIGCFNYCWPSQWGPTHLMYVPLAQPSQGC